MSEAQVEAHEQNLAPDEQDDYIQEGVFAKELAAWLEAGLRQAGLKPDDNYAADFGRVLPLQAPSGGKVMVTCCNYDEADATEDGLSHIVGVKAQPGFKARFFHDPALQAFNDKIAAAIGQMIDATPEIKRVREN